MRISDWSSDVCSSDLASRQTARLRILPLGTGRQGRLSVYDFSIVLGLHMVRLLFVAIILGYIARKKPGFKEQFRMFIYGYFTCVLVNMMADYEFGRASRRERKWKSV